MLFIFSGLPGVGKSTIAKALALELKAVYLRIDVIEQSLKASGVTAIEGHGYAVAMALAGSNLALGNTVICDSVNPWELSREAFRQCAIALDKPYLDIEVVCSDLSEHRRRVETREPDIEGHQLPDWEEVLTRDYQVWQEDRMLIDTSLLTLQESVAKLRQLIPSN